MNQDNQGHSPKASRKDELEYTQSMLGQLAAMAQARRDQMLGYLIEMAYIEVSDMLRNEHAAAMPTVAKLKAVARRMRRAA